MNELDFDGFLEQVKQHNRLGWGLFLLMLVVAILLYGDSSFFWLAALPVFLLGALNFLFGLFYQKLKCSAAPKEQKKRPLKLGAFLQFSLNLAVLTLAVHLSGGPISVLPVMYVIYFGLLSIFLMPAQVLGLIIFCTSLYLGLMASYRAGWLDPVIPPIGAGIEISDKAAFYIQMTHFCATLLNSLAILYHARLNRRERERVGAQKIFFERVHQLANLSLRFTSSGDLYVSLVNEIQSILGVDDVYITRWDEESGRVFSGAASGSLHERYVNFPPTPRHESTLTSAVKQAGRPLAAEDVFITPYLSARIAAYFPSRSLLAVPMYDYAAQRFLGALLVGHHERHHFTRLEIERAEKAASVAGLLISRTKLHEETLRRAELLEKFAGQFTDLISDLKSTSLLQSIVESARSLLNAQRAAIHLSDPNAGLMRCEYSMGLSPEYLSQLTKRFNQLAGGDLLGKAGYLLIPDVRQDSRTSPLQDLIVQEKFCAYAVFSVETAKGRLGALSLYWDNPHAISSDEVAVGRLFASRAGSILESAKIYAQVSEEALTDSLTGLPNRRCLDQRILDEVDRSKRYHHSFALLMIDLDGFKAINDTFGHPIGDSVLRSVADALRRTMRSSDFLARYGGDEFAVILPESDVAKAIHVAEKLRQGLAGTKLHLPQDTQRSLSASIGIAMFPQDTDHKDFLIACADQRLYRAKRSEIAHVVYAD